MTTRVLIQNMESADNQAARGLEVKESRAGGPRTIRLKPGEQGEFEVHGSSRVTVSELGADGRAAED
jgi:hypothetical protein